MSWRPYHRTLETMGLNEGSPLSERVVGALVDAWMDNRERNDYDTIAFRVLGEIIVEATEARDRLTGAP